MAQPKTGLLFRSELGMPEMAERLEQKFPETAWRLRDSDMYRYYYVVGKRQDGVIVKILPEDDGDKCYLGVYFADMPEFPGPWGALGIKDYRKKSCIPIQEIKTVLKTF